MATIRPSPLTRFVTGPEDCRRSPLTVHAKHIPFHGKRLPVELGASAITEIRTHVLYEGPACVHNPADRMLLH